MAIESRTVQGVGIGGRAFLERWGTCGCEYYVETRTNADPTDKTSPVTTTSKQIDFQDLMIDITQFRAVSLEQEVLPMERRMRWRNQMLEKLGTALSEITYWTDKVRNLSDHNPDNHYVDDVRWSDAAKQGLTFVGVTPVDVTTIDVTTGKNQGRWYKCDLEKASQKVKTKTDRLNNDSSQDSTRLQSLVDHRDQAYQMATTLMTSISDTRTNLIRNIG